MNILIGIFGLAVLGIFFLIRAHCGKTANIAGLGLCFLLLGLISAGICLLFVFADVEQYLNQGQPNVFASELPAPVTPPMSRLSLFFSVTPSLIALFFAALTLKTAIQFFKNCHLVKLDALASFVLGIGWIAMFCLLVNTVPKNQATFNFIFLFSPTLAGAFFYFYSAYMINFSKIKMAA